MSIASQLIKPSMHTPLAQLFKEDILEVSKYADLLIVSSNSNEIDPPMKLDTDVKNHGCIYIGGQRKKFRGCVKELRIFVHITEFLII